jgi:hypothetical protein
METIKRLCEDRARWWRQALEQDWSDADIREWLGVTKARLVDWERQQQKSGWGE